ncbi:MAG: hypothetical protein V9H26_19045 [Verrucomicrobiota bacterium]
MVGIRTPQNALSAADAPHYFNIEPSPVFTSYARAGDGSFTLNFSGITNAIYSLWATTNLTAWQSLGLMVSVAAGFQKFRVASKRIYRIVTHKLL